MPSLPKFVFGFAEVDKNDIALVGGKGANLGELVAAGFPVPPGFIISSHSYFTFLEENNLTPKIKSFIKTTNIENPRELQSAANQISNLIKRGEISPALKKELIDNYKKLSGMFDQALVAVRSSATAEDLPSASFAGQQATFLNIKGEANLLEAYKACLASLFTPRAIFYRQTRGFSHFKVGIAAIIQKMIQSEISGVAFTADPVTGDKHVMVIEAIWGLGELIVQGSVIPDRYRVERHTLQILSKEIGKQNVQLIKVGTSTKQTKVSKAKQEKQKLTDDQIKKLAKILREIHLHYYFPQDIEWAFEKKKFYIVQTRPVTTVIEEGKVEPKIESKIKAGKVVISGVAASPGIATGKVKLVKDAGQIDKVKKGDILVTKMTSPDFVPAMKRVVAIVTDEGGQTSHAAIVSRELGIPCVVGTKNATKVLNEEMVVTVDGTRGVVFLGKLSLVKEIKEEKEKTESLVDLKTATKLYVNLAEPERATQVAKFPVDGVGLLRAEFMMAEIGIHPKQIIKEGKQEEFIEKLAQGLETFCSSFNPRPVMYRTTDFKTNEYRNLKGGQAFEPEEPNPLLGYRGAFRYIQDPDVFELELGAIKKVRDAGFKNLWLMIPYVRSPGELTQVKRIIASIGLLRSPTFKLWLMVELPVNVILLEEFIKVGIDGVSVGSNDLTMLILGTDRDNSEVATVFDERSPAVLWALERVIKSCQRHGVTSSICGQAPSTFDDLVEKLVEWGITSISVNPDAVGRVQKVIYQTEKKIATGWISNVKNH